MIRERQRALEAYLNAVLSAVDPLEFAPLATFLDVFANTVRQAGWQGVAQSVCV